MGSTDFNYESLVGSIVWYIGLICAIAFIILTIALKRLQNRTYVLLLLFLICEIVYLLMAPEYVERFIRKLNRQRLQQCAAFLLKFAMKFLEIMIMFVLGIDRLMQSNIGNDSLIGILLVIFGIVSTISVFFCAIAFPDPILIGGFVGGIIILLLLTIIKDVRNCCSKENVITADEKFRLTIVKIYVYTLVITTLMVAALGQFAFEFLALTPAVMLLYSCLFNEDYKTYVLNLFGRKEKESSIDGVEANEDPQVIGNGGVMV